jgi:hypothetical protein
LITAILAVVLPMLFVLGICASYLHYLLSGSETARHSLLNSSSVQFAEEREQQWPTKTLSILGDIGAPNAPFVE